MRLKLVPADTHIDFLGFRTIALALSGLAVVASVVVFFAGALRFAGAFLAGADVSALILRSSRRRPRSSCR